MKTKVVLIVALISVVFFSSCRHNPGRLIGKFNVVKKEKANPDYDFGFITVANSMEDTLKVFVSMEEEYLNIRIGDTYLVGRNHYGSLFLNDRPEKGIIGYSKVWQKEVDMSIPKYKVITMGQDTISVNLVAEVDFYNISEGDSIFVKKNRDKEKPHYYVE
jgi:hypothetical protein